MARIVRFHQAGGPDLLQAEGDGQRTTAASSSTGRASIELAKGVIATTPAGRPSGRRCSTAAFAD